MEEGAGKMILAVDPGNIESAYVLTDNELKISAFGKIDNEVLLEQFESMINLYTPKVALEMVACYGMAVGREVFETCVMIGQLKEICRKYSIEPQYIYRKDEKISLCNSMKAKDTNIRQALIDRFAIHDFKNGKGTKKKPDVFYGFSKDVWAAMAVAVTYHDMYLNKEVILEELGEIHTQERLGE